MAARVVSTLRVAVMLTVVAALATGCAGSSADDLSAELRNPNAGPGFGGAPSAAGAVSPAAAVSTSSVAAAKEVARVTASATPNSAGYKIGPEDVIELTVYKVPELSKAVQVSEAGTANLPLVGEVTVGGRTTREVEQELTRTLGAKYLRNPQVNVAVREYNSQRITVEGEVKKPGVFPIRGRLTLLQAMATAGGFEAIADTSEILVFRTTDGKQAAAKFDIEQIRNGKTKDLELRSGDVIVVNSSSAKIAFQNVLKVLPLASIFVTLL